MKTGRNIQRAMFASSLREQMDKMVEAHGQRKSELVKRAEEYLNQGLSHSETEELLGVDGFNSDMVRSCMDRIAENSEISEDEEPGWGFEIEDTSGNILSHADLGMVVTAANESEAMIKIEALLAEEDDQKFGHLEQVTNIFKL